MQRSEKFLLNAHRTHPYSKTSPKDHSLIKDSWRKPPPPHQENTGNRPEMGSRAIDLIKELQCPHVHVKDRDEVDRKLSELIRHGKNNLQVVADFDSTMSAFTLRGQKCVSSHKAIDDCTALPEEYRVKAHALRDHFYAIEVNPSLTVEQKIPHMVEWWTTGHDLLIEHKCMTRDMIRRIVSGAKLYLREGCSELMERLHAHDVPLLVFSAGLGNVIEEVLRQQAHIHDNVKIVSNMMSFNDQGELTGFDGDLIHVFNKNENAVHDSEYFRRLQGRSNVLLMGDSLGDLNMADGADAKHLLKIGFLNDKIEERLETYKEAFDIVLVSDETMDVANAILDKVFQ